jgi:hypothetical protein
MFEDHVTIIVANANLDMLCDVETFWVWLTSSYCLNVFKICPSLVILKMSSYVIL